MMELLKKWLDGSINWKEEKQLRNQAQEDIFLADALEGLDTLPDIDHAQNTQALQQRLQQRIAKNKKRSIYPLRATAAAAILLLSAGIWWNIQSSLNQSSIAGNQIQNTSSSPLVESKATYNSKSIKPTTAADIVENVVEEKKDLPSKQKTSPIKELALVQKELPSTNLSNKKKGDAISKDNSQEIVEIIPEASNITMQASTIVMETPSVEAISIMEEDADGIADIIDVKEAIVTRPAPPVMAEQSTRMMSPPADMETISAVAESKKTTTRAARRKQINPPKVFPVGGEKVFQNYIKTNMRYPQIAKDAIIKGTVFLVFTLDTDGGVKEVEVTKSLHPEYDAEAIRLLKEGPKWISPAGIGYCEISFAL